MVENNGSCESVTEKAQPKRKRMSSSTSSVGENNGICESVTPENEKKVRIFNKIFVKNACKNRILFLFSFFFFYSPEALSPPLVYC